MILTLSHCFSTTAIFSGGGMVNVSAEREDIARRHCSKAGLFKKNKIIAGALEAFSTAIQFPFRMNTVAPVLASYLVPSQRDANCASVYKDDFIFEEMLVLRNLVPRWHLLCTYHERLRSGCDRIDLENEWLGAH